MEQYYYNSRNGQTYSSAQMLGLFGLNTAVVSIAYLNSYGFYPVQASSPDFDTLLYNASVTWNLVAITGGQGAVRVYTPVAKPLPEAKVNGSNEAKAAANAEQELIVLQSGLSTDTLTAVSSQDPLARPASFQTVLDGMTAVSDNLSATLIAIDSATSVDEINDVVNPPTGIIFTGRGSGLGPEDLNVSYYVEFNSVSLPESDTELYVPSTSLVIPYGSGGPNAFDSMGNAFNPGGPYTIQIRNSKTGSVIASFEVPLNPTGENVAF